MPASSEHLYSARSRAVFAELVQELGDGREIDLGTACATHPDLDDELRSLHANWTRLNGVLDRLGIDADEPPESSGAEARNSSPARNETHRLLERFSSADHAHARYEEMGEIARGGMGVVLRVHDSSLERDLAMKFVRDPGAQAAGAGWRRLARFLGEARLTGKLDHPGIVPIHDVGVDAQGRVFFTMPLVRGRKLTEVIDLVHAGREGWTQGRALEAVLKVCDTVAYAHSVGVVHRDLKPDNVMIGRFGETYVMDWGLARTLSAEGEGSMHSAEARTRGVEDADACDSSMHGVSVRGSSVTEATHPDNSERPHSAHGPSARGDSAQDESSREGSAQGARTSEPWTHDGAVLGTPAYMPPEQAAGQRAEVGPQADIYSVGAILYHLLSGRAPYGDEGRPASSSGSARPKPDILEAVRNGPPIPLALLAPRASPELVAIAAKAMARSRSQRYSDMRAMSEDLRAYMDGRVVHAHDGGALAELKKWIKRNKGLSIAVASALILAIGGLAAVSYVQTTSKNEILKLSDLRRIEALVREAETLWPAVPERVPAMEHWLKDAAAVLENRELHERALREMRERVRSAAGSDKRATPFADNEDQWRLENQAKLASEIERLADPDPRRGLIANVRKRLADARSLRARSIQDHSMQWKAALESIADANECPSYNGLKLTPQLGVIPLGRDPQSKLWEFAHLASGVPAQRLQGGTLALTEETGIVLVLIPGGAATIGSQPPRSGKPPDPFTDSLSQSEEQPPCEVDIAPFFLSKFELTRAQWQRWCSFDPESLAAEIALADPTSPVQISSEKHAVLASSEHVGNAVSGLHPIGAISWFEAVQVVQHMDLALPTEAQWEYAARAGTRTRWWSGNEQRLLFDTANLGSGVDGSLPYVDGFEGTAPVNALRPNPWGLFNVHGNVSEWTQDLFWPGHGRPLRADDGLTIAPDSGLRATRGGNYLGSATSARSAARTGVAPANHDVGIGVRPTRALEQ